MLCSYRFHSPPHHPCRVRHGHSRGARGVDPVVCVCHRPHGWKQPGRRKPAGEMRRTLCQHLTALLSGGPDPGGTQYPHTTPGQPSPPPPENPRSHSLHGSPGGSNADSQVLTVRSPVGSWCAHTQALTPGHNPTGVPMLWPGRPCYAGVGPAGKSLNPPGPPQENAHLWVTDQPLTTHIPPF